ncbi:MAG: 16S rRNA (cytosine(1402)-N(4))-methyltransferase RsmH [Patescibacteria group bacterium]|jgi:16S rRNA (cytosine1402-N4)-methyltransferase
MLAPNQLLDSNSSTNPKHIPVLLEEVIELSQPKNGENVIDCTLGLGGYAEKFLEAIKPNGRLLGLDRDGKAIGLVKTKFEKFNDRLILRQGNFGNLKNLIKDFPQPEIIVADLGLSSFELDDKNRGFAFQKLGPLDMRMDQTSGKTAADLLNTLPTKELEKILREYGEEPKAELIARGICEKRKVKPFVTTKDLTELIDEVYRKLLHAPPNRKLWFKRQLHPATQTFQALRIAVNDEISELEKFLPQAFEILRPKGRLAVVSFHSLEDRLVKRFFQEKAKKCSCPPEQLQCTCDRIPEGLLISKKPIQPSLQEINFNPRARSAKLRAIKKN